MGDHITVRRSKSAANWQWISRELPASDQAMAQGQFKLEKEITEVSKERWRCGCRTRRCVRYCCIWSIERLIDFTRKMVAMLRRLVERSRVPPDEAIDQAGRGDTNSARPEALLLHNAPSIIRYRCEQPGTLASLHFKPLFARYRKRAGTRLEPQQQNDGHYLLISCITLHRLSIGSCE